MVNGPALDWQSRRSTGRATGVKAARLAIDDDIDVIDAVLEQVPSCSGASRIRCIAHSASTYTEPVD